METKDGMTEREEASRRRQEGIEDKQEEKAKKGLKAGLNKRRVGGREDKKGGRKGNTFRSSNGDQGRVSNFSCYQKLSPSQERSL